MILEPWGPEYYHYNPETYKVCAKRRKAFSFVFGFEVRSAVKALLTDSNGFWGFRAYSSTGSKWRHSQKTQEF